MVNRLTKHIEYTAQALCPYRNLDWCARILCIHTTHKTIGRAHCDTARYAVTQMLHDLNNEIDIHTAGFALDRDCVQNRRQFSCREFNIYYRSDDLYYFTFSQW